MMCLFVSGRVDEEIEGIESVGKQRRPVAT